MASSTGLPDLYAASQHYIDTRATPRHALKPPAHQRLAGEYAETLAGFSSMLYDIRR